MFRSDVWQSPCGLSIFREFEDDEGEEEGEKISHDFMILREEEGGNHRLNPRISVRQPRTIESIPKSSFQLVPSPRNSFR